MVDWSQQLAGVAPSSELFERAHVTSWAGQGSKAELLVVDSSTDPPSPLPDGKPALMAKLIEGDAATGGIWVKPFFSPPLQGWMEVEVVLDDTLYLSISALNQSESDDPADPAGRALFIATMVPGERISMRVESGVAVDGEPDQPIYRGFPFPIPPGEATRFGVVWDFKTEPATIGFQVNGEAVVDPSGNPFQIEVATEVARTGLDAFRIGGNGFIGNVTVSGEQ